MLGMVCTEVTHVCVQAWYHNRRSPRDSLHVRGHEVPRDGRRGRSTLGAGWLRPQEAEAVVATPTGTPASVIITNKHNVRSMPITMTHFRTHTMHLTTF